MIGEVTWRVSPHVFSDLHRIIAKHGMGLSGPNGINPSGPEAACLEILEKYDLRKGVPLKVVVDYKLVTYMRPEYGDNECLSA